MLSQTGIYAIRAMSYIASQQDDAKPLLFRTIAKKMPDETTIDKVR
ncbi:MAG: hypothetical protein V3S16_11240 [Candidatus Desulfatibia sp.]